MINLCSADRRQGSRRCLECLPNHYQHRGHCYECETSDVAIAFAGPMLVLLFLLFVFVPLSVKQFHRETHVDDPSAQVAGNQQLASRGLWGMLPDRLRRISRYGLEDTRRLRMAVLAFNQLQLIWAVGLMPYPWPSAMLDLLQVLSLAAFDYDVFRPQCAFEIPFFVKFIVEWSFPYVVAICVVLGLTFSHFRHRDLSDKKHIFLRGAILEVLSLQIMLQLMSHLRADLLFLNCAPCEDDGQWCLIDNPLTHCSLDDPEWLYMMTLSAVDLVLVVLPSVIVVLLGIWGSWLWQHGEVVGIDRQGRLPWQVSTAEFWVRGYQGYSKMLRLECIQLREYIRHLSRPDVSPTAVWEQCVYLTNMERWIRIQDKMSAEIKEIIHCIKVQHNHHISKHQQIHARSMAPTQQVPQGGEGSSPRSRTSFTGQLDLGDLGTAVESLAKEMIAKKRRERQVENLVHVLDHTVHFVREVESRHAAVQRRSGFWTYSWEYIVLLQKLLVVFIASAAPARLGATVMTGTMFGTLIVLVMQVTLEPHKWHRLNDLELVLDVSTMYIVVFAQLQWDTMITVVAFIIAICSVLPLLWALIPREASDALCDEHEDEDEDVTSQPASPCGTRPTSPSGKQATSPFGKQQSSQVERQKSQREAEKTVWEQKTTDDKKVQVDVAVLSALLGHKGLRALSRGQVRIRYLLKRKRKMEERQRALEEALEERKQLALETRRASQGESNGDSSMLDLEGVLFRADADQEDSESTWKRRAYHV
eukprot:TRINITY_DN4744_c0_g3_i1.p1 TRINITY_DN4744_c0_g3~~TRINITY_DN4744_c0_g3_i1.p1  ORF type:complete len:791 (-),score=98.12 TRINITY_DN4744_c0_g3_i1:314-2590(-)